MTPYAEHDITANGIRIHYYRAAPPGGGPPVVLVHGLTDQGLCWKRVADRLRQTYDVIMPDTRGHGFSEKPETGYSVEDRAADIAGFIDGLGLDRPVLIGHSLGGDVSTAAAALYPDKVRGLVLEDPAWLGDDTPEQRVLNAKGWAANLLRNQSMSRADLIARQHTESPTWHEDELGPWADANLRMSEPALIEILTHYHANWRGFLGGVQCPTLLLTGDVERGIIINPDLAQEAASLNPYLRIVPIAEAGHSIHRDRFEPYMEVVTAYLGEVFGE